MTVIKVEQLTKLSVQVLCCGQPMKTGRIRTTWQGQPGEGDETTTYERACKQCDRAMIVTDIERC